MYKDLENVDWVEINSIMRDDFRVFFDIANAQVRAMERDGHLYGDALFRANAALYKMHRLVTDIDMYLGRDATDIRNRRMDKFVTDCVNADIDLDTVDVSGTIKHPPYKFADDVRDATQYMSDDMRNMYNRLLVCAYEFLNDIALSRVSDILAIHNRLAIETRYKNKYMRRFVGLRAALAGHDVYRGR